MALNGSPELLRARNPFDAAAALITQLVAWILAYFGMFPVKYYGAVGDGVTDDRAAIQAAFDAAGLRGGTVYLPAPSGPFYATLGELQIKATYKPFRVVGVGHNSYNVSDGLVTVGSEIRAGAAMRSVLAVLSPRHQIDSLVLHGNRLANYGLYFADGNSTQINNVAIYKGLLDGTHLAASGNNNHLRATACWFMHCGTLHATAGIIAQYSHGERATIAGTAAVNTSNATVTITGGPNLTTLGIRKGDLLRVTLSAGASKKNSEYYQIASVAAGTITLQAGFFNLPTFTGAGLDYAIGIGDGWHEERWSSNGVNLLQQCVSWSNGSAGMRMNALYGDTIDGGDYSYNNQAGFNLGDTDLGGITYEALLNHPYVEDTGVAYFLGLVKSLAVISPAGITSASTTVLFANNAEYAEGVLIDQGTVGTVTLGMRQNFILQLRNNGGTIEHRIVADTIDAVACALTEVAKVTGASNAYAATPFTTGAVDFTTGVGVSNANKNALMFNTVGASQSTRMSGVLGIEQNTTGTVYTPALATFSENVNGVTKRRVGLRLIDAAGGQAFWTTASIPVGTTIAIRVQVHIK